MLVLWMFCRRTVDVLQRALFTGYFKVPPVCTYCLLMGWTEFVSHEDTEKGSGNIDMTLLNGATLDRVSTVTEAFALQDHNIWLADE